MKILICHNYYQQPGGEGRVFEEETKLLQNHGHEVLQYVKHNDDIKSMNPISVAIKAVWNFKVYGEIKNIVTGFHPEIVHFHNTFPLISPAAYYAAKSEGAKIVQTLHNYRMLCPKATFFRENQICEDCLEKKFPWPGILNACYHDSRKETAVIAIMSFLHKIFGTYKKIDRYIAISDFIRNKHVEGRVNSDKIIFKPNFVVEPDFKETHRNGKHFLFVGRLTEEKGIMTLLKACNLLGDIPVLIVGDGAIMPKVNEYIENNILTNVWTLGYCTKEKIVQLMKNTIALIVPSIWNEPFGLTIVEAFASKVPVIASKIGGISEIIKDEENGFLFTPGDASHLASVMNKVSLNNKKNTSIKENAYQYYLDNYSSEINYQKLLHIYNQIN